MNFWDLFFSFLFAFIVKDFYDILVQSHIKKYLKKFKKFPYTIKKITDIDEK